MPEFAGSVKVDESNFDDIKRDKYANKETHPGGVGGRDAVVRITDQLTGQIHAEVTESTCWVILQVS